MKVFVTGVAGQLGWDVMKDLTMRGYDCIGSDILDKENIKQSYKYVKLDITDEFTVKKVISEILPEVVIHCSAYTLVDKAEDEPELCHLVNAVGTENIAKICKEIDAKMVYISTDYVFDGTKDGFYEIDNVPNPINIYGKTKLAGEKVVQEILEKYFVVRISWVFGVNGNNFVKTMLHLGKEHNELNVVADQIGSPTYTVDLAQLLADMIQTDKYGIYHATNEGECSWAEFAEEIFKVASMVVKVNHIKTLEYPTKARRPMNSRLAKEKLIDSGFKSLPVWQDALARYIHLLRQF